MIRIRAEATLDLHTQHTHSYRLNLRILHPSHWQNNENQACIFRSCRYFHFLYTVYNLLCKDNNIKGPQLNFSTHEMCDGNTRAREVIYNATYFACWVFDSHVWCLDLQSSVSSFTWTQITALWSRRASSLFWCACAVVVETRSSETRLHSATSGHKRSVVPLSMNSVCRRLTRSDGVISVTLETLAGFKNLVTISVHALRPCVCVSSPVWGWSWWTWCCHQTSWVGSSWNKSLDSPGWKSQDVFMIRYRRRCNVTRWWFKRFDTYEDCVCVFALHVRLVYLLSSSPPDFPSSFPSFKKSKYTSRVNLRGAKLIICQWFAPISVQVSRVNDNVTVKKSEPTSLNSWNRAINLGHRLSLSSQFEPTGEDVKEKS